MTIATIISTCPAPVSDAAGVTTALEWMAVCEAFALEADTKDLAARHTIINLSEIYFSNIQLATTDYATLNNYLMHLKTLYEAQVTIDS